MYAVPEVRLGSGYFPIFGLFIHLHYVPQLMWDKDMVDVDHQCTTSRY